MADLRSFSVDTPRRSARLASIGPQIQSSSILSRTPINGAASEDTSTILRAPNFNPPLAFGTSMRFQTVDKPFPTAGAGASGHYSQHENRSRSLLRPTVQPQAAPHIQPETPLELTAMWEELKKLRAEVAENAQTSTMNSYLVPTRPALVDPPALRPDLYATATDRWTHDLSSEEKQAIVKACKPLTDADRFGGTCGRGVLDFWNKHAHTLCMHDMISSNSGKLLYFKALLKGDALQWFVSKVEYGAHFEEVKQQFLRSYYPSDDEHVAKAELKNLRLTDQIGLMPFHAKFRSLSFRAGLDYAESYDAYVLCLVKFMEFKLEAHRLYSALQPLAVIQDAIEHMNKSFNSVSVGGIKIKPVSANLTTLSTTGVTPVDIAAAESKIKVAGTARWYQLSKEEVYQLFKDRKCFCCKEPIHRDNAKCTASTCRNKCVPRETNTPAPQCLLPPVIPSSDVAPLNAKSVEQNLSVVSSATVNPEVEITLKSTLVGQTAPLVMSSLFPETDNFRHQLMRTTVLVDGNLAVALWDPGASHCVVDASFLQRCSLYDTVKHDPVEMFGSTSETPQQTVGVCDIGFVADSFKDTFDFVVAQIPTHAKCDMLIGHSWFSDRDATMRPSNNTVSLTWNNESYIIGNNTLSMDTATEVFTSELALDEPEVPSELENDDILDILDKDELAAKYDQLLQSISTDTVPQARAECMALCEEFKSVFLSPTELPATSDQDFELELKPGYRPTSIRPRRLSFGGLNAMREHLEKQLRIGWIRPSNSPHGSPAMLAPKPNGKTRFVVDYRHLNDHTIKSKFQMPRIDDLLDSFAGSKYFSKLDFSSGFHQIRCTPDAIAKTAFTTPFGKFEYVVMPQGVTNGPCTFTQRGLQAFFELLGDGMEIYMDDMFIHGPTIEIHNFRLRRCLEIVRSFKFILDGSKGLFCVLVLPLFGFQISEAGIATMDDKTKAIREWPQPTRVKQLRSFLGLANYYRRFVNQYASIAAPLHDLTGSSVRFEWTDAHSNAFAALKEALCSTPVLAPPMPDKPFLIFFDGSSTVALGAVLCQTQSDGKIHPCAFISRKLTNSERTTYAPHETEIAAMVFALDKWRHYLDFQRFIVYTDNQSLQKLKTSSSLTRRDLRWLVKIQSYQFDIHHIPREQNVVADALSMYPYNADVPVSDATMSINMWTLADDRASLIRLIKDNYAVDSYCSKLLASPDRDHVVDNAGILWLNRIDSRVMVAPRCAAVTTPLLLWAHNHSGHLGIGKTVARLSELVSWRGMHSDVVTHVRHCDHCQRANATNQLKPGLLHPLALPMERWTDWEIDFIGALPRSKSGFNSIIIVGDRFTKRIRLIPNKTTNSAPMVWALLKSQAISLFGYPRSVVSDRDSLFVSDFWKEIARKFCIELSMSTTDHHETPGQVERSVRSVKQMLKGNCNHMQTDWDTLLPDIEMFYNSAEHASTGMSPFTADLGRILNFPTPLPQHPSAVLSVDDHISKLHDSAALVTNHLQKNQDKMKRNYDKTHRNLSIPVGGLVLIKRECLPTYAPMVNSPPAFQLEWIGPFKILAKDDFDNYDLELPALYKVHRRFHVSKLRMYLSPLAPFRPDEPAPDIVDNVEEFEVESIQDHRKFRNKIQFLIKWKGYGTEQNSWEGVDNLIHCPEILSRYREEHGLSFGGLGREV
jgi:hypothetical protein